MITKTDAAELIQRIDNIAAVAKISEKASLLRAARLDAIKGKSAVASGDHAGYVESDDGWRVEIQQAVIGGRGVEAFVRAWYNDRPVGFGADGSVEIERMFIPHCPLLRMVDDGPILRRGCYYVLDHDENMRQIFLRNARLVGKLDTKIIPRKRGNTTFTFYSDSADGEVESDDATYSLARAGTGAFLFETTTGNINVGQNAGYELHQAFIQFDTSSLSGLTISSADLSLRGVNDFSTNDDTIEARRHDWGPAVTTADWVAGASLSGKTLLASRSTSGWSTSGFNDFTSDGNFITNLNTTGTTGIILHGQKQRTNSAPTDSEYVSFRGQDVVGDSQAPVLTVVASSGNTSGIFPFFNK